MLKSTNTADALLITLRARVQLTVVDTWKSNQRIQIKLFFTTSTGKRGKLSTVTFTTFTTLFHPPLLLYYTRYNNIILRNDKKKIRF
jgi:hypothetical protein